MSKDTTNEIKIVTAIPTSFPNHTAVEIIGGEQYITCMRTGRLVRVYARYAKNEGSAI